MVGVRVTEEQIREAAAGVHCQAYFEWTRDRAVLFNLRQAPCCPYVILYPRYSRTLVCWHGHREFFRHLWHLAPGSEVNTYVLSATDNSLGSRRIWYNKDNFESLYPPTGNFNWGTPEEPIRYRLACNCERI
jgi:hypothetical protein